MQRSRSREGETEDLHHGRHGRHGRKRRRNQECANEADSGGRREWGESGAAAEETDRLRHGWKEGGGTRDEAGGGSREGGIGGRAGAGRTIPGRKRTPAGGAAGGSARGRGGEKMAASEANLEMIKQLMAQRFSDMPAARGPCERSQIREPPDGECPVRGRTGEPCLPASGRELEGVGQIGNRRGSARRLGSPGWIVA